MRRYARYAAAYSPRSATAAKAAWLAGPIRVGPGPCSRQIRSASRLSQATMATSAAKKAAGSIALIRRVAATSVGSASSGRSGSSPASSHRYR